MEAGRDGGAPYDDIAELDRLIASEGLDVAEGAEAGEPADAAHGADASVVVARAVESSEAGYAFDDVEGLEDDAILEELVGARAHSNPLTQTLSQYPSLPDASPTQPAL